MSTKINEEKKKCKIACLVKIAGIVFFVAGLLIAAACYYTLYVTTKPAEYLAPPAYNPAPGKNDFKITVFGDWMLHEGAIGKIAAESHRRNAAFAVCLGDFVHPAQPSIMKIAAKKLKKHFKIPVYATPGNHDVYNAEDAAGFAAVFGNVNNCFSYGDTLFILLESAKVGLSDEQLQFLKFVLTNERPKYSRCVVFSHVPPVTIPEFDKPKYRLKKETAEKYLKILEEGNVDLLVCGHVHHEMNIPLGKTRLLVCPPSGQGSRNKKNPQFGSLQLHFMPDGSIKHEFVYCGTEVKGTGFEKFLYRRLNQHTILFSVSLALLLLGGACILLGNAKKTDA